MKKVYNFLLIMTLVIIGGFIGIESINAENVKNYNLWVNGEQFTSEKTTINCGNGTAVYNANSNTLTLNNAKITKSYTHNNNYNSLEEGQGIYYLGNNTLTIELLGKNEIIDPKTDSFYDAITDDGSNINIKGTGSLNIKSEDGGITAFANNDVYKDIVISGGDITIMGGTLPIIGNVKFNNYSPKILVGRSADGTNADLVSLKTFNKKYVNGSELHEFVKIGKFNTYKITKSVNQIGYNYVPKEAYKGEKIVVYDKDLKKYYDLKSVKIYKSSNNSDITKKVGYDSKKWSFVMPDYPIKVVINMKSKGKISKNIYNLKANLVTYNSVKLHDKFPNDYGIINSIIGYPIRGYYTYVKVGKNKKYNFLGKSEEYKEAKKSKNYVTYEIYKAKNLKPGKKYTFKVVYYGTIGLYGDVDVLSTKSKTITIRTLKKMSKPKVKKEDSKHVKLKIKEVKGATGYKVAVSKYKSKGFKTIATIRKGNNSTIIKAKKNKKLYYKVRAYKKEGKKKIYAPWSKVKGYKIK